MWGKMTSLNTSNRGGFMSVGYVCEYEVRLNNGSTYIEYVCEAGSESAKFRGETNASRGMDGVANRGHYALFDTPQEAKAAFTKRFQNMTCANATFHMLGVKKVKFYNYAEFEDVDI